MKSFSSKIWNLKKNKNKNGGLDWTLQPFDFQASPKVCEPLLMLEP